MHGVVSGSRQGKNWNGLGALKAPAMPLAMDCTCQNQPVRFESATKLLHETKVYADCGDTTSTKGMAAVWCCATRRY